MKQINPVVCILLAVIVLLTACTKRIEAGTKISVSGIVFDNVKKKPLPNATLYLYGASRYVSGISYSHGPLELTTSDNFGRFSIQFIADGTCEDYGLAIGVLEYGGYFYGGQINYVVDNIEPMFKFNYSTNIKNAVVKARELNYTKVNLKVISNPYDSFYISTYATRAKTLIIGKSIDTTVIVRHLPNENNYFEYSTESRRDTIGLAALNSNPDPNTHHFGIFRYMVDTVRANMSDTMTINKTISSSLLIPRY